MLNPHECAGNVRWLEANYCRTYRAASILDTGLAGEPKMRPYIFGKRNLIHIINVKETLKGLLLAKRFLTQTVSDGKDVLLIGTKRQAKKSVEENALRVGMHFVNDRWLGGTLTNFREIRRRIGRLDQLEALEAEGQLDTYSKKEGAALRREVRKIRRNLQGIRRMNGAMFIIDQRRG